MDEMNATVGEVAENAAKASDTSDTARTKAQEGAQLVRNVVSDITEVQKQSLEVKADMATLGKQADGIGQIMVASCCRLCAASEPPIITETELSGPCARQAKISWLICRVRPQSSAWGKHSPGGIRYDHHDCRYRSC